MSQAFYLGVDGGGTKTRFLIVDATATPVADITLGTSYFPQIGLDGTARILQQGIDGVLQMAALQPDAITMAFLGLAGYGENATAMPQLDAMPAAILGHQRYRCGNDMICGWAGSLACADGINIVAGTGSIGYGQRFGNGARAGGWGYTFSDEGSAYWITLQALNAYSKMSDGRLPQGALHSIITRELQLKRDLDLCTYVYDGPGRTRTELAQLSRCVAEAAAQGDSEALRIYQHAGHELAQIAGSIAHTLQFASGEIIPISYSGGSFNAGALLLTPFKAALQAINPCFDLRAPLHEPHLGAALYAKRLAASTETAQATA
jgi:N-acetylglucosamine kinase-like BadF-type ATPase